MGSRTRLHESRIFAGGWGWVPAFARTTGGGEDQFPPTVFARVGSPRDDGDGDGSPPPQGQREGERMNSRLPSSRGQVLRGMMGMGPRLREDNGRGRGWVPAYCLREGRFSAGGGGWVPAFARTTGGGEDGFPPTVFARVGSPRDDGDGDGSPPSRGQREGERMNSRLPSSRGQVLRGMMGMGPRLREDNGRGRGWVPAPVFARAGSSRDDGDGDGSPPSRGQRVGEGG